MLLQTNAEVVAISPWGILIGLLVGLVVWLVGGGLLLALIVGVLVGLLAGGGYGYYGRRGPPA